MRRHMLEAITGCWLMPRWMDGRLGSCQHGGTLVVLWLDPSNGPITEVTATPRLGRRTDRAAQARPIAAKGGT